MAGDDAKKKRVARGMANLCISCAGSESWIRRWARGFKKKGSTRDLVADLPDDVLIDILSHLPMKSLCLCKLVSKCWRNVISHPEHRKKMPQTLAGFFYNKSYYRNHLPNPKKFHRFASVSRAADPFIDSSLSFLSEYESIDIKDSCNGLLLCYCWKPTDPVTMDFVVCNPATKKWVVVPDSGWSSKVRVTRLGFDPAISSHFHVFEFIPENIGYTDDREISVDATVEVVAVYSSKTGVWSLNDNDHNTHGKFTMPLDSKGAYFNGVLHLTTVNGMVFAIDVEGKIFRSIPFPVSTYCDDRPLVFQGHLYLTIVSNESDGYELSVCVLEDYNSENWTLKHNVDPLHLFGAAYLSNFEYDFSIISIHPEHDMIFMVCGRNNTLLSYELDHMRLRVICRLGRHCSTYIPYVPLFSESLADEQ